MWSIRMDNNMNRTFVAMYQNNDQHYTLGYDYHTNEYFKIKGRNQSNATTVLSVSFWC